MEKTNIVVVRNLLQGQGERKGGIKRDSYTIDVDRGRNCYSCGGFGHLIQNYIRWRIIGQGGRIEYEDNQNTINYLNREENLLVLN